MKVEGNTGLVRTQSVMARARHDEDVDRLSSPQLSIVSSLSKFGNKLKDPIFPRDTRQHPAKNSSIRSQL
jgi:hypothetical protein